MPIPQELAYTNEAEFTDKFLLPLLQRLGFSIVVNYHGQREFGKDLIFGEVDRFGHVAYHGMQAKYVANVSLEAVETLITDAKQAFANPFRHPQKGSNERISTFFAVNGGTISDQASEHFFNSLSLPHGGNVRIIDGKGLLALDRMATMNRVDAVHERLLGLLNEFVLNSHNLRQLVEMMEKCLKESGPYPVRPLRSSSAEAWLVQPFLTPDIPLPAMSTYYEQVITVNWLAESMGVAIGTKDFLEGRLASLKQVAQVLYANIEFLHGKAKEAGKKLGPLAPI